MTNAYDEIPYPTSAFRQTHPDRLAAHARLFGLAPAPIDTSRVLEIGAGDGSNLIPMALGDPEARFVGFDLAAEPVRRGREVIEALGLSNIRLFQADLQAVDFGDESFDYIIAHGVYSWVPPAVADALMRLVRERLAPQGVAFASFATLPGGYLRLAIRNELLFETRDIVGLSPRMEAAMRRLQAWAAPSSTQHPFQRAVAEEAAAMKTRPLAALTHDELSEAYHPAYLQDFADHAARHGLQIVAGAGPTDVSEGFPPPGEADGGAFDYLGRAQQADFDPVRFFRQPLLVRAEAPVVRRLRPEIVAGMHLTSGSRRVEGDRFEAVGGRRFDLADAVLAGVLDRLAAVWPATAPVADLGLDDGRLLALMRLHLIRAIEWHSAPSRFIAAAGDRPAASPLARLQAARGQKGLTTLRHTVRELEDDFTLGLIASLDGTRTRAEIARDIAPRVNMTPEAALPPLAVLLDELARTPLLVQ